MRALAFILLLLALPADAQEMKRWPDVGAGGKQFRVEFFISGNDQSAITPALCLQKPQMEATWAVNAAALTVMPIACNITSAANHFPAGFNARLDIAHCGLNGPSGDLTDGEQVVIGFRWHDQDTSGGITAVGTASLVTLTANDTTPTFSTNILSGGTVCPYAATGCSIAARINSETITTGAQVDISCEAYVTLTPAS